MGSPPPQRLICGPMPSSPLAPFGLAMCDHRLLSQIRDCHTFFSPRPVISKVTRKPVISRQRFARHSFVFFSDFGLATLSHVFKAFSSPSRVRSHHPIISLRRVGVWASPRSHLVLRLCQSMHHPGIIPVWRFGLPSCQFHDFILDSSSIICFQDFGPCCFALGK